MKFRSDLEALVLAALEGGPQHGYGIVKAIRSQSDDVLKLGEAQLYPVLHRMEEAGQIKGAWESTEGKPSRKVYSLTSRGDKELKKRRQEWESFKTAVEKVMERPRLARGEA